MWLTVIGPEGGERIVQITGRRAVIGRDAGCDVVIDDPRVSRLHAELRRRPDGAIEIEDLGSANGTDIDGTRAHGSRPLVGGERVRVGGTLLVVSATAPGVSGATVVSPVAPALPPPPPPPPPAPAPAPPPRQPAAEPSTGAIERARLRRTSRLAVAAAIAALLVAVVAVTIVATGGDDDAPASDEASLPDVVDRVRPSTVLITARAGGTPAGTGTGWVLDAERGLIVTNHHVINGGDGVTVGVDGTDREARIVATAPCEDLALLEVADGSGLVTLPLGRQSELRQGQSVVAVGFPGTASSDANLVPTLGVVSVVRTRFDLQSVDVPQYPNVIQTDAAINPGNSGGPLVDFDGRLVGVNSAGITLLGDRIIQGQGYAIGVDRVREVVTRLRTGRSIGWTGMSLVHVVDLATQSEALAAAGLPAQVGLGVSGVVPGTPADVAGFGDQPVLVTAVNGTPMDGSLPAYCSAIASDEDGAVFSAIPSGQVTPRDVRVEFE